MLLAYSLQVLSTVFPCGKDIVPEKQKITVPTHQDYYRPVFWRCCLPSAQQYSGAALGSE